MPRPKGQNSVAKNQLQLAMALSSSLEESNKRELSNLTEEIPASVIESGIVPKNIKHMQKEFLDKLKMPRPGPSCKSKKPPKPVPTLTTRSSEERLRIFTEKVALVLFKEENFSSEFDSESCPKNQQKDVEKENVLWKISGMSPSKTDRNCYYAKNLSTFVSPSKITIGSSGINKAYTPRRLNKPVKPETSDHYESSSDEDFGTSCNHRSTFDLGQSEYTDQEYRAQLELQSDWQRMLQNLTLSDIGVIVKEKVKLPAHKLVLFARCPRVLDDLDGNVLHWERITRAQALAFLEFIYCGKLILIRALGENVNGVVHLARRYKVTELLKLIFNSSVGEYASASSYSGDISSYSLSRRNSTASPDLFADCEELGETSEITVTKEVTSIENCVIDISSEEDDEMLKNFFGTCNVASILNDRKLSSSNQKGVTSSPQKCESFVLNNVSSPSTPRRSTGDQFTQRVMKSGLESVVEVTKKSPLSEFKSPGKASPRCKLTNTPPFTQRNNANRLEIEGALVENESDDDLFSPVKQRKDLTCSEPCLDHDIHLFSSENICVKDATKKKSTESMEGESFMKSDGKDISDTLPVETRSLTCKPNLSQTARKHSRKSLFQTPTKKDDSFDLYKYPFSNKRCEDLDSSPPSSKRKKLCSDDSDDGSPFRKRSRSPMDTISISSNERTPRLVKLTQPIQHTDLLTSPNINSKVYDKVSASPLSKSPRKCSILDLTENYFCSPKSSKSSSSNSSSPNKINAYREGSLLNDSFIFDVNDSVLLKGLQQTPVPKSKEMSRLHSGPCRTPLDNIKTSSPVTPLPNFDAMSDEEFQAELKKYGLKVNLSRRNGIKMLRHIYEQLHPVVELVTRDGKDVHIPIEDKTSVAKSANLPSCAPDLKDKDEREGEKSEDEPLSQQSLISSGGEDMLEETFLEDEEGDMNLGETSVDLKKNVRKWITSQPDIHEMILSYEPIWLDSVHDEIKTNFKTKFTINQLMDILDEEGITFRAARSQRNTRKKQSPKKKQTKVKTKEAESSQGSQSSPKKLTNQLHSS